MSGGQPLSRSTFNRNRDSVLDMFGIIIDCQRRGGNVYYIYNEEELSKDTVQNWMYSSLSINMALENKKLLFERILLEQIPSAGTLMETILKAMVDNHQMRMTYKRYEADQAKDYTVCPYCLKLFRCRWYVLMRIVREQETKPDLAVFSIDRICYLDILPDTFTIPKDFSASAYFSECFGVVVGDDTKATAVRLRAYGRERFAMQDLPIHHSQRIVREEPDYLDFEVFLRPTDDFKAYVLSKGKWLEVISPATLAMEIKGLHEQATAMYHKIS